jgi:hypothetical protein
MVAISLGGQKIRSSPLADEQVKLSCVLANCVHQNYEIGSIQCGYGGNTTSFTVVAQATNPSGTYWVAILSYDLVDQSGGNPLAVATQNLEPIFAC